MPGSLSGAAPGAPPTTATVVLLHGLGLRRWAMWRMAHALAQAGYRVVNLTYPSRTVPLEALVRDWLPRTLREKGVILGISSGSLHFVTHSMGGIVVRGWLKEHGVPANLGRVVMLAPPNQGAPLVDRIGRWRTFGLCTGVNGRRLGTGPDSYPRQLGPWPGGGELGIIAGNRSLLPWFRQWSGSPGDGKVPVTHTHLEGCAAHLVLPCSHTWIQYQGSVIRQVKSFLQNGSFSPEPRPLAQDCDQSVTSQFGGKTGQNSGQSSDFSTKTRKK